MKLVLEGSKVQKSKILWTNSQCVLNWIKLKKSLPRFVEKRLKEIGEDDQTGFQCVNTKENLCGIPYVESPGKSMNKMVTYYLWWGGPKWLHKPEESWTNENAKIIDQNALAELAKQSNGPTVLYEIATATGEGLTDKEEVKNPENICSPYGIEVKKYSAFNKRIHTVAWIRFINNLKFSIKKKGPLSKEETEETRMS